MRSHSESSLDDPLSVNPSPNVVALTPPCVAMFAASPPYVESPPRTVDAAPLPPLRPLEDRVSVAEVLDLCVMPPAEPRFDRSRPPTLGDTAAFDGSKRASSVSDARPDVDRAFEDALAVSLVPDLRPGAAPSETTDDDDRSPSFPRRLRPPAMRVLAPRGALKLSVRLPRDAAELDLTEWTEPARLGVVRVLPPRIRADLP